MGQAPLKNKSRGHSNEENYISTGEGLFTPLHSAARSGDVDKVRQLLGKGIYTVNCIDSRGQTPLHCACMGGHLEIVRMLISEFKADMTIQDEDGDTALMLTAKAGHDNVVHGLLSRYRCPLQKNLLHIACRRGDISLVREIFHEHKADVNAGCDNNDTPVHVAALCGKEEVALALINEFQCDISVKGHLGRSLLHSACRGGNVNLVN